MNSFWNVFGAHQPPDGGKPPPPPPPTPDGTPGPSRGLLGMLTDLGRSVASWMYWPGPKEAPGTPAGDLIAGEQIRSGPRDVALPWLPPYIDDPTQEPAAARLAYRKMLASSEVSSAWASLVNGVMKLELKILPARSRSKEDKAVADYVQWQLTQRIAGGFPHLVWSVLSGGLPDGYSICEPAWGRQRHGKYAGKYVVTKIKAKDVGNDAVLVTDHYRNVVGVRALRYNEGRTVHPARFLIYRHRPLYDSPVGLSAFRCVYRDWWMLDVAWKLRAVAMDKRALPFTYGTYRTLSQKQALEEVLSNLKSQWWASVPEGTQLQVLEIAGSSESTFKEVISDLTHRIHLGLRGATLQSLEGTTPNARGNASEQAETADDTTWALAASVQALLNDTECGLIKDIVDLNFVVDEYPRAKLGKVDLGALQQRASIYTSLAQVGLPLSKSALYDEFDVAAPDPEDPGDALQKDPDDPGPGSPDMMEALAGGGGGDEGGGGGIAGMLTGGGDDAAADQ